MTQLTPHFALAELTRSQDASRKGLDNTPSATAVENLRALCEAILEPLRAKASEALGREAPISISSGFRSAAVNAAIGGQFGSQHLRGEAADFEVPGMSNLALAELIAGSDLPFDQLILEHHDVRAPASGWIHCSHVRSGKNRRAVLRAVRVGGATRYLAGLTG